MPSIDFNQLFDSLKTNIISLAEQAVQDEVAAAKQDGQSLLDMVTNNVEIWAQQLASGAISTDDATYLVKSQLEYNEMVALKNAGLAEVRIDEFKSSVISCIIDTISKAV